MIYFCCCFCFAQQMRFPCNKNECYLFMNCIAVTQKIRNGKKQTTHKSCHGQCNASKLSVTWSASFHFFEAWTFLFLSSWWKQANEYFRLWLKEMLTVLRPYKYTQYFDSRENHEKTVHFCVLLTFFYQTNFIVHVFTHLHTNPTFRAAVWLVC